MKIDRSRIKKSTLEVPAECQALIDKLWLCSWPELLEELKKIDTWTFGKCELYHWIDILDVCDSILEQAAMRVAPKSWQLKCDVPENEELKELLLWVLHFTTLLIEHSFSRHLYNSVEHLLTLLSSCDLHVVLGVLNLLYMFSKRSNFIARLMPDMRNALLKCLTYLAESWGGRENGFGLADCCRDNPMYCPNTATTLHYEFYSEEVPKGRMSQVSCIHLDNVDKLDKTPAQIMNSLIETFNVPKDGQMLLFTHVRLAYSFSDYRRRLHCVQARLQALSVLLYSNSFTEIQNLLYPGILDELVELLELNNPELVEIRAAALRTLTSITHLDRSPRIPLKPGSRLNMIIDVTGAGLYHGFLPQMVRNCIGALTSERNSEQFPLPLATALFSFLYHLASYEPGGEALVSCGMMESLLRVINWPGTELEHITFVTRAVRVIDLITNIDMQAFQAHGGLTSFINRLEMEMMICRKEQPFEIQVETNVNSSDVELDEEMMRINVDSDSNPSCSSKPTSAPTNLTAATDARTSQGKSPKTCLPQRAALLKSMLNFLKKALQDPSFSESIRHVMDGSLPSSLKHIISNAEYYGPSLFLLATDVVTAYVFQEPSLLSSLQDNGLTDVVLHALLVKNVPATREVLGSLPNVFSALCLNARGLASFVRCSPFDRLFKVLLSPMYLSAMRRRRSSDPIGDTASNLGNAMDELMRHQPSLKADATSAIIKLLEELCNLGRDPKYVCWRPQKGSNSESPLPTPRVANEAGSSDEEEDDEEEASTSSHPQREDHAGGPAVATDPGSQQPPHEKTPIALVDYILNVMKFVDAILSNNSTDDHCREFVNQNGLSPLLSILGLPNLPVDYPVTLAAQSVASVCKSILNLAHEPQVMRQGLMQLNEVLQQLAPLYNPSESPQGSLLLHELATAPKLETAFATPSATPLLHAMAATNGYVVMFVHVCRTGQLDIRTISMTHWGSELGLGVLRLLCDLYTALVWESTILLALCSDDASTSSKFSKEDVDRLFPPEMRIVEENTDANTHVTTAMEALSTEPQPQSSASSSMDVDEPSCKKKGIPAVIQLKYIKPLLGASSRLGRALAELFGLLVKLCVGFPIRTRRGNHLTSTPVSPTPAAQEVAKMLGTLLATGLNWKRLPPAPLPKFRLTYLICSVGFTSPMLFDEKKFPYHLMLQKFVKCGGQKAFFGTFYWAITAEGTIPIKEGIEHPDLPDGTGEFLDTWLILLEKMVNPKAILDSNHMLPSRQTPQGITKMFDPLAYLQQIHKEAFDAMKHLWGKRPLRTYGPRMVETMLTILRHILRGEKLIEERKLKEEELNGREANGEGRRREIRPEVNLSELQQLMDMGFSREHCYEALILTATMEHATDYLLNNFFPHSTPLHSTPRSSQQSLAQAVPAMELEEDQQLFQAIAMSLDDLPEGSASSTTPRLSTSTLISSGSPEATTDPEPETMKKEVLDKFTADALPVCLQMLEVIPETVYHVCALINTILRRNGEAFSHQLLNCLAYDINTKVDYLINALRTKGPEEEIIKILAHSPEAYRAAAIIHLYMLIFEEIRVPCAKVVHTSGMLPKLLELLSKGTAALAQCSSKETPKWMAPLLLLIDLLEKVAVGTVRKTAMHKYTNNVWRWFDLSTGKWTLYSPLNNKLINDSYWRGDNMLRIASGRRRYTIVFQHMLQTNEDSGKARPIMRSLIEPRDEPPTVVIQASDLFQQQPPPEKSPSSSSAESMEVEADAEFFHRRSAIQPISGISPEDAATIVVACVGLLEIPVNRDTLHAAMQLIVRFTRDFNNAKQVARMDAVKILLRLTQNNAFPGFPGLSTILIRHILEEPFTLQLAFEKVLRAKTLTNIPPTYKELYYVLRECSSAICRDTPAFRRVAEKILRIDLQATSKRNDEEDYRFLMKSIVTNDGRQQINVCTEESSRQTIYDLLNALAIIYDDEDVEESTEKQPPAASTSISRHSSFDGASGSRSSSHHPPGNGAATIAELLSGDQGNNGPGNSSNATSLPLYMVAQAQSPNGGAVFSISHPATTQIFSNDPQSPEKLKKTPLLSKSAILKILSDAVRSYTTIAKLITEFTYSAGQSELIKEDCSAIAFVLDQLMPSREGMSDHDLPSLARGLIAAVASCNHSPEAQLTLVSEVKAALQRTLAMPESSRKHQHVQDLVGIVTIMIENCPPVPINSTPLTASLKLSQFSVNNMVRFMMRKNIITDLARIPHSLDLSSPKMAVTMNAALKPLETLSRIMSCPSSLATTASTKLKLKPSTPAPTADEPQIAQTSGISVSETTNAQGEEAVEDPDNTEHDVSGTVETLSEESVGAVCARALEGRDGRDLISLRNELEDLIDRCAEEDRDLASADAVASESSSRYIFDESIENPSELQFQQMNHNEEPSESSSDDSDSNASEEEHRIDRDANTDIDEQVDDEEDDDVVEGEDNEDGDQYDNETFEIFDTEEGMLRIPGLDQESEDFLMIEYSEPNDHSTPLMPWISSSFSHPFSLFEEASHDNSNGASGTGGSRIPPMHPLLMTPRQAMAMQAAEGTANAGAGGSGTTMQAAASNLPAAGASSASRSQRLMRTRRYQYVQMNRSSASPAFFQRLMENAGERVPYIGAPGHGTGTGSISTDIIASTLGNNTRVVVMDNGLGIFTNTEEEQINFVDQSGYLLGPSLAATLNNVPTSMHWWNEEARILDGDSQADCSVVVGYEASATFLRYRNEELAERREKHKKQQDEDELKKSSGEPEKKKTFSAQGTSDYPHVPHVPGLMDIFEPSPRPPLRPRNMAMLAAAQEVAQATENLAGSIVESVLHPRAIEPPTGLRQGGSDSDSAEQQPSSETESENIPIPPTIHTVIRATFPLEFVEPDVSDGMGTNSQTDDENPLSEPEEGSQENEGTVVQVPSSPVSSLPEALELIAAADSAEEQNDITDPLGLIPGSVPFPAPSDPDDGFFRVNHEEFPSESNRTNSDDGNGRTATRTIDMSNSDPSSASSSPFLVHRNNLPDALELIAAATATDSAEEQSDMTDPLGLIPSSSSFLLSRNEARTSQNQPQEGMVDLDISSNVWLQNHMSSPRSSNNSQQPSAAGGNNSDQESGTSTSQTSIVEGEPAAASSSEPNPDQEGTENDVPEGVDPSFLAALPEDMRAEVISEHLRLQRIRTRAEAQLSQSAEPSQSGTSIEVNPDFLAALPPSIQEEVLAQQRLEQQRQAAAAANPNEPVDAAAFFQELPHSLRQAILTDMEDSQISVLPPELAAEAQNLRREWEARNRQLVQERFLTHVTHNSTTLSSILRTSAPRSASRQSAPRYTIQSVPQRTHWTGWPLRQDQQTSVGHNLCGHSRASNVRTRGRQILDYESICCLLVLLFVDDSRLNTVRLHRVFRNLCYHAPTRDWIIKALLSIMEKSNEGTGENLTGMPGSASAAVHRPSKRMTTRSQTQLSADPSSSTGLQTNTSRNALSSWLNISMDAALGCRATVFHVHKVPGRRTEKTVTVNPQAAPFVYRHALDILISLAKTFPSCFVPGRTHQEPIASQSGHANKKTKVDVSNFWDILIRLDSVSSSRKGKSTQRSSTSNAQEDTNSLETSPFGQLLKMLAAPVVRRSPLLMDKLLRLLSLISAGLQVNKERLSSLSSYDPILNTSTLNHLALVIKVLTSNTCSEEGLEDATALLLNMTVNLESIRETVLKLLLQGARSMAENVCEHIDALLKELRVLNRQQTQNEDLEDASSENMKAGMKGILSNRFTKDTVVVTAPKKVKSGLDLQLSSMAPLISKTSSQAFFLRVLKVIVQMRESVQSLESKKEFDNNAEEEEEEIECDEDEQVVVSFELNKTNSDRVSLEDKPRAPGKRRIPMLSEQLELDHLWNTLSDCLTELAHTQDSHAVLVLQPAVEAFFLVHASSIEKKVQNALERAGSSASTAVANAGQPSGSQPAAGASGDDLGPTPAPPPVSPLPTDVQESSSDAAVDQVHYTAQQKFLKFAETHRTVLNQILRQCNTPLLEGPFAVLVNHTRVLDFDVKRRYFRSELERADEGHRREELAVHVRRTQVFEDSFRELHRRTPDDWKNRFYIVFEGEEGQDAGGLLREWYMIISREIFNPMYALFTTSPGDRVTYMINSSSHYNPNHLCYFKFVGRVIAKAIYDNKLLECYFTRSFYKHILGISVKHTDMESEDYSFYQGLVYLMENHVSSLGYDVTFSTEVQEFGVTEVRDLLPDGRNMLVTEENKMDYIQLVCQMKMTGAIRKQLNAFLEGFYDIIPSRLISIFNEQELELLISGLPNVDIDDLKANTEYYKYQPNSLQIQWFWRALREFDQAERAKFLQFVTGTSKVPLQGFAALEGMNGIQKFQIHRDERSTDRLPSAHTCFNQLDLPVYETYTKLRTYLLKAIHECSEGFGFA